MASVTFTAKRPSLKPLLYDSVLCEMVMEDIGRGLPVDPLVFAKAHEAIVRMRKTLEGWV